jgi:hypothetical protein
LTAGQLNPFQRRSVVMVRGGDQVVGKPTSVGLLWCAHGPSEEPVTEPGVRATIQQHREQDRVDDEPSG